jgi:hypothetical protein
MGQGNKTRKSFLNKSSGKKDTLEVDYDNNNITVEDASGITFASFKGGSWEADLPEYAERILIDKGVYKDVAKTIFDESVQANKNILSWSDSTNVAQKSEETLVNAAEAVGRIGKEMNRPGKYPTDTEGKFYGRYPINQKDSDDFDHFKITCYEHQPGGLGGEGFIIDDIDDRKKVSKGVVTLPMQPSISEAMNVNWGSSELNPLQIMGANVAMPLMGLDFDGAMNALTTAGNQAMGDLNSDLIKAYFAGQAVSADLIGRGTGQAINNNVEVLFNGPELRSFNYTYRFTPREPKEAKEIKQIIRFFKKSMAPKRSASRIFLKSPNVFKLKYTFKDGGSHPFLNNIKMCALKSFNVDYTPDGSYSTYSDDGEGDGSMTSYQVSLGFMEMTPIYNDDYWNDPEGREGTGF